MKRPLENITLRIDASGEIWLMVPNAAICISSLKGPVVRKNFLKWAEDELAKPPDLTWEHKKEILTNLDPWGEDK